MKYSVKVTDSFAKDFFKNHKDKKEWLERTIERLEKDPQYGKPLRGRLHGTWQLRTGPFRLWYEINEEEKKVTLKVFLNKNDVKRNY